jgi:hypothetical protein
MSKNVYRYKEYIDSGGAYGPTLLPKIESSWFSTAKFLPVVCLDCGYVRFYAAKEARHNLETSTHWEKA